MPTCLSGVQLFETLWTIARQAPLSMGFSRREYWSGLPCPLLRDLPDPGIESLSPVSPALAGQFFTTRTLEWVGKGKKWSWEWRSCWEWGGAGTDARKCIGTTMQLRREGRRVQVELKQNRKEMTDGIWGILLQIWSVYVTESFYCSCGTRVKPC